MAKMKVDVLECASGVSKKGNAYNIALVRVPSGTGRVGKVFSDVKLESDTDVPDFTIFVYTVLHKLTLYRD